MLMVKTKRLLSSQQVEYWFPFVGIAAIYLVLIAPTVQYLGISWDEEIDLRIAQAYLTTRGLFLGLSLDESQTRLPMFFVSLIYRLVGTQDLYVARWASVLVGALTLLAVYVYGKSQFGQKVGLLAAGILAISPFFLSFARVAFTESDIYVACAFAWLLVTLSRLQEQPTVGHAAMAGVVFGFSIATKATVLVILPAIWVVLFFSHLAVRRKILTHQSVSEDRSIPARTVLLWSGLAFFVILAGVYSGYKFNIYSYRLLIRLAHYGLVLLSWLVLLAWSFRFRNYTSGHLPLAFFMTGVGLLTFLVIPPDHLTNKGILESLFIRADNEMSLNAAYMTELAVLHLSSIVFKSTLLLGISLVIAVFASLFQWRQVGLLPLLILCSYFLGLLILPLGQTFYTVPLLPVLSVLAAYQFIRLWTRHQKVASLLAVLVIGWWGMEITQSYPDYQLNGYQWLGKRVLVGRSTVGYRSIVYTSSDGLQQAVEWLNSNAEPDQVALVYGPWHLVEHAAPNPAYRLVNKFEESLDSRPDYVVVHIDEIIWSGNGRDTPVGSIIRYPFDPKILEQEYEKVFAVQRAFDLEMVSVWQRK